MEPLDLFQYTDFRTFLSDYVSQKKQARKAWSYQIWARKIGVKSPATLAMIVNGQRNPSQKLTSDFCQFFNFGQREAQYFHDLVELEKNKNNPRLSVLMLEKLSSQHPKKKFQLLDHASFSAISNWHFYAIREMTLLKDFRDNPEWISRKLEGRVSPAKVSQSVELLLKLGLLKRDKSGKLVSTDLHVDTSKDIADEGLKRFHEQVLSLAQTSVRSVPVGEREISGTTFALTKDKLPLAKELIRDFRMKMCQLLEQPGGEAVYQLEVAFFPLTKDSTNRRETCH